MNYRLLIKGVLAAAILLQTAACTEDVRTKNHGPIVLGDSSTIITETDPSLLQDQVADLQPVSDEPTANGAAEPAAAPVGDTAAKPPAEPEQPAEKPAAPTGNGLTMAFREATVFIPNIVTRSYGKTDLRNARGATYELTSGSLAGNQLRITGGTVQKVTQRYQTRVVLKDDKDILPLESLGAYSSDWKELRGSNGSYAIAGLEPSRLEYSDVRPAAIRNAVLQATRRARLSRREAQDWIDFARNVRAANQAPCAVLLSSVSWRITGKDAGGKTFNKEIRIDLYYNN